MIVTQLLGGLGNQLFQYAVGRAIAARQGTTLRLDTSQFERYRLRSYALDHFCIEAHPLTPEEQRALRLHAESPNRIKRAVKRLFAPSRMLVVRERSFGFDPSVLESPAHCYLQ